jgi:hypothetical protein
MVNCKNTQERVKLQKPGLSPTKKKYQFLKYLISTIFSKKKKKNSAVFGAASWQNFCKIFLAIFDSCTLSKIRVICRSQKILPEFLDFFSYFFCW